MAGSTLTMSELSTLPANAPSANHSSRTSIVGNPSPDDG
jgi:hypothetical protein